MVIQGWGGVTPHNLPISLSLAQNTVYATAEQAAVCSIPARLLPLFGCTARVVQLAVAP